MKRSNFNKMMEKCALYTICLVIGICTLMVTGCSSMWSTVKKLGPQEMVLKKKLMIFPPIDHSGLPAGKAAMVSAQLADALKKSDRLLVYVPPENLDLPEEVRTPKFGVIYYDPDLVKIVKQMNMNAVLALYLAPMEVNKGRAGIWPFRYDTQAAKLTMVVNVMDAANGCLYLTDLDAETAVFASKAASQWSREDLLVRAFEEVLPGLLERSIDDVEDSLAEQAWSGRIVELRRDMVVINAGEDVGIRPDQLFVVYAKGESFMCNTGRTVGMLGEKKGIVKVVSVTEDDALAIPFDGGGFEVGQKVFFKSD